MPFPSPGDLPDPGIEPGSPALQTDTLTSEPPGKPHILNESLESSKSPFPIPGNLPDPGIEPGSPTLQVDALISEPPGKPSGS